MGEVFAGRYELADPIGRGGVGAVWRAWDHRRRRYVAAKVLLQSDAHSLLRFVREQALRIDHPHVLAPASWAADDDKVLFTMDLVAGGSLVHLVGDYGPLPPSFVCTLLDQLLAGLAAVHAEGVVHRDIKPANILLEATGTARPRLRLSDFGIAMRLGEPRLTETNLVVGTPGYLAPEQMMGAEPDFPADLFAVGLVALYLLEGAKPDAKALIQYFAAHGTPGAPQSVPEPLWQVVASLLQPDPQARFRTATGARKALAAARELLPDPGPDDETIEIFDQLGPLPPGFGSEGPLKRAPGVDPSRTRNDVSRTGEEARFGTGDGSRGSFEGGDRSDAPYGDDRGNAGSFAADGGGRGAFRRGPGEGVGGAGAGVGAGGGSGSGGGSGGAGGADGGAGADAGAGASEARGAREVGGGPSWPGQSNGVASRPDEVAGTSSWFGGRHGVGPRPGEAGEAPFRSGEGNEPGAFPPGDASQAPSWSGGGSAAGPTPGQPSRTPSQPEEASGAPNWPGGGDWRPSHPEAPGGAPSWHSEARGIPPQPQEASGTPYPPSGANGAAYGPGEPNGPVYRPGDVNGPAHRPGEPSGPGSRPGEAYGAASWPGEGSQSSWPGRGSDPSWPGEGSGVSRRPGESGPVSRPAEENPPSWPAEANSASWPRESPPAPWPEQADATSWPREAGPPPSPGTAGHETPWPAPADGPSSASDTGSFHLPPPRPTDSRSQPLTPPDHQPPPHQRHPHPQAQAQPHRPAAPARSAYVSPHDPTPSTHVLPSPQPHAPRFPTQAPPPPPHQLHADPSTASYTAQSPQVPLPARSLSRARRSGPPAKVAIPLLLLALACYAVGFWALTQI
ncbi:protein kinase [Streptomyces pseudovenezuelae]|uniref:serine/threonine-protein kinase n=1 Tax=Streptomyces pseudovenezuelae TaxID=67350 RepID=UPI003807C0E2